MQESSSSSSRFVRNHNFLHGHRLIDLFEANSSGIVVFERFISSVYEVSKILKWESPLLRNYYAQIMLIRTRQEFRVMLKYIIYIIIIVTYEKGIRAPWSNPNSVLLIASLILPILIAYLVSIRNRNYNVYVHLSLALSLGIVFLTFSSRSVIIQHSHGLPSPGVILMLGMFTLLPLRSAVCLCVCIMYVATSVVLELYHISKISQTTINNQTNDLLTRLKVMDRIERDFEPVGEVILLHIFFWLPVLFVALYLNFWNNIRRFFAFFKLSLNAQSRRECKTALKVQVLWIEAIMPAGIRAEYQTLLQKNKDRGAGMWVFNKTYPDISILFADIVGFTRMSSNKTAHRVVTMLNDLFNRFDELCEYTKCEKIGTLGDCYYCVSGCPVAQPKHAICCIEMGLGMCRVIKAFNRDFEESVGMRIGVHTGRVNAAIIGMRRFRFDVYSYDVIIASALESSGRAGRVHISENTFDRVKSIYNVSLGEPLQIRKEQVRGIAGMELVSSYIETYYIDPRSSQWRTKHERYGRGQSQLHSVNGGQPSSIAEEEVGGNTGIGLTSPIPSDGPILEQQNDDCKDNPEFSLESCSVLQTFEQDMNLIYNLQTDPEKQYTLFYNFPIYPVVITFCDSEAEWHYHTHLQDPARTTHVDSQKVAALGDVSACFIILIFTSFNCFLINHAVPSSTSFIVFIVLGLFQMLVCGSVVFTTTTFEHQLDTKCLRRLFRFLSRRIVHECCIAFITISPTLLVYLTLHQPSLSEILLSRRQYVALLAIHCMLIHTLPLSSYWWARGLCTLATFIILIHALRCDTLIFSASTLCTRFVRKHQGSAYEKFCSVFLVELMACLLFVLLTVRENERNCRLCFYVSREVDISGDESEKAVKDARDLLDNIIPRYVFDRLQSAESKQSGVHKSFNYAVSIPHAGVAFATISNFFSQYYREDYKGGENALKLLNSIVCMFDAILDQPEMKDVEKIKTINDCYMVAAGLNKDEVENNANNLSHLVALMNYCHLIIEALDEFNDMYIVGTDKFEIKVGYNSGPLTAGIIGTTKPMYDIWGDTVNVASRMYSTGVVSKIQAPQDVATELDEFFEFVYRGEVFVKGKGDMRTYLCEKK